MSTWAGYRRTRSRGSRSTLRFSHSVSPFFFSCYVSSFCSLFLLYLCIYISGFACFYSPSIGSPPLLSSLLFPSLPLFMACLLVKSWLITYSSLCRRIDYYGVTFDHLVPSDDRDPETLQINIIETDDDDAAYANMHLLFPVDAGEYRGKKVLAVPRCCSKRKGTTDRGRINESVIMKEELALKQAKWREQGIYPPADM